MNRMPALSNAASIRIMVETSRFKAPKLFLRRRPSTDHLDANREALDELRCSNPINTMPPPHLSARNRCLMWLTCPSPERKQNNRASEGCGWQGGPLSPLK